MLDWRQFDIIDSTNETALQLLRAGAAEGTVVCARAQRAGRGQYGRVWQGSAAANVYLSLIARPPQRADVLLPLALVAGIGVVDALTRVLSPACASALQLKWPNDVWLAGKKCAGILCEAETHGSDDSGVAIGIGVNVNERGAAWDADVLSTATSLALVADQEFSVEHVAKAIAESVWQRVQLLYRQGFSGALAAQFCALDALRDMRVRIDDGQQSGMARGVDHCGRLLIEDANGVRTALVTGSVRCTALPSAYGERARDNV